MAQEIMDPKDCPMMVLYDPLWYIQDTPLIVETQDFKCTFEYKLAGSVLNHNHGVGNLRQYVQDLIPDDFVAFCDLKPSDDPHNILSKTQSGRDEHFVSVTEYKYPRITVTIKKYTSDDIKSWLQGLSDLIESRTIKELLNHRRICKDSSCMWFNENSLLAEI